MTPAEHSTGHWIGGSVLLVTISYLVFRHAKEMKNG
jgi:hypothetical protein